MACLLWQLLQKTATEKLDEGSRVDLLARLLTQPAAVPGPDAVPPAGCTVWNDHTCGAMQALVLGITAPKVRVRTGVTCVA